MKTLIATDKVEDGGARKEPQSSARYSLGNFCVAIMLGSFSICLKFSLKKSLLYLVVRHSPQYVSQTLCLPTGTRGYRIDLFKEPRHCVNQKQSSIRFMNLQIFKSRHSAISLHDKGLSKITPFGNGPLAITL